jgi:4'-phosphopantetheinyl transferase
MREFRQPNIAQNEVYVWDLRLDSISVSDLYSFLSADECRRANDFKFAIDRDRFITCRGLLRVLLSSSLNVAPETLSFVYNPWGKPYLNDVPLYFNVSHSSDRALIAIASEREIGVDIEQIRPEVEAEEIANRFFSTEERNALHNLPSEALERAFFGCWTRKESYVKARGDGLSLQLNEFAVSVDPDEPAALLRAPGDSAETLRWRILDLDAPEGFAAALTVQGHDWRLVKKRSHQEMPRSSVLTAI